MASASASPSAVKPDVTRIAQVAELLNVDLNSGDKKSMAADPPFKDDLSLILNGGEKKAPISKNNHPEKPTTPPSSYSNDIRSKYAAKLQSAGIAGVSAVDRAKHEISGDEQQPQGDAAGHWAARARATASPSSPSRWMAGTGTGKLLNYLHQRSMKLGLVGTPVIQQQQNNHSNKEEEEGRRMDDFLKQMKYKVEFAAVIRQDGTLTGEKLVQKAVNEMLQSSSNNDNNDSSNKENAVQTLSTIAPDRCLWVSDRDDCLRAAKAAGLVTVRVRPANAPRGNVSAHYTVESVPETQTVINEINGISFSTVLQQGS